ncbi:MAG: DUF6194 family protein [Brevundimonas sp.]|jgi:hypothetical protein|uniref:DUF6194 family protein n=1 Tax=Brevundimonas sp. TaxID=1871086 RepID=UPI003919622C
MMADVSPAKMIATLLARFSGSVAIDAWGETSLFYNPGRILPRGVYFATLKEKDGENDRASQLDRANVFRFNVGTSRSLFFARFGPPPPRPTKGCTVEGNWDFTQLDVITPHPVYGWMSWVSVLNPSPQTLDEMDGMIDAAFLKAKAAFERKLRSR